jgi:hypothetical protein
MIELDGNKLKCPHCGDTFLHHVRVDVHARPREDGETVTTSILVRDGYAPNALPPPSENPSTRRDGVTLCLVCEGCDGYSELQVAQHKGVTLIDLKKAVGSK